MAEADLFRAVVAQAFTDAAIVVDHTGAPKEKLRLRRVRDEARAWLLAGGKDLLLICQYAEIDAGYIRRRAREAAARGWELPQAA